MTMSKPPTCAPVIPTSGAQNVLQPIDVRDVRITGGLWAHWQQVNRDSSFPLGLKRLESEGNIRNVAMAAGLEQDRKSTR